MRSDLPSHSQEVNAFTRVTVRLIIKMNSERLFLCQPRSISSPAAFRLSPICFLNPHDTVWEPPSCPDRDHFLISQRALKPRQG